LLGMGACWWPEAGIAPTVPSTTIAEVTSQTRPRQGIRTGGRGTAYAFRPRPRAATQLRLVTGSEERMASVLPLRDLSLLTGNCLNINLGAMVTRSLVLLFRQCPWWSGGVAIDLAYRPRCISARPCR
jgi:hypothetical protein